MNLTDFTYTLPPHLIAQSAVHPPDRCKLMVLNNNIEHKQFKDLTNYLQPGDVLVVNRTKVAHAKILGKKPPAEKSKSSSPSH